MRAHTQNITSHLSYLSPSPPWLLTPPRVYDFLRLVIDDINELVKDQGYAVTTFRSKIDKLTPPAVRGRRRGRARRGSS